MCQLVLVLLAVFAGYAGAATIPWCCTEKSVGGVNYTLVNTWENTTMYGCEWDCVYEQNGLDGSRVCFKEGGLPVVCYEDECVFPNSLYNGTAFSTLYSFSTLGLQNHTDCQKLCKDHNKINDNNQKKCNYWDFSQLMHSPYTSICDMYENIQGHRDAGKGTFRGPINKYCPYLECVFPNSQYTGSAFFPGTVGLKNHTDCQNLCKDHNKINQKKCNFWNFSPPVYSTYTSNCDMYENITGIEQNTGNGTFRGPINNYCPY